MSPYFSIVIPFYNALLTIEETLNSIKIQTFQDLEVIIVNDGSDSIEGLNPILENFHPLKIILISKENGGVSSARNLGASVAHGTFLLFLDSDDLISSTFLEKIHNVTINDPAIDIVGSHMQIFGKESRKQKIYLNSFKDFLIKNTLCYCLAIKYEKFEQFGPYDTYLKVAEDWDLWITLIENGCKVHIIGEFLFQYRKLSSNSLSGQMNKNRQLRYNSWNRIYQKHTATYQLFYSSNILKMIKESNEHQAKNCSQLKSLKHLSVINIVILLAVAIIGGTKLDDTVYEAIIICMAFIAFIISFLRIQRLLNKNAKADFFSVE